MFFGKYYNGGYNQFKLNKKKINENRHIMEKRTWRRLVTKDEQETCLLFLFCCFFLLYLGEINQRKKNDNAYLFPLFIVLNSTYNIFFLLKNRFLFKMYKYISLLLISLLGKKMYIRWKKVRKLSKQRHILIKENFNSIQFLISRRGTQKHLLRRKIIFLSVFHVVVYIK